MVKTIGNPLSWTARALNQGSHHIGEGAREIGGADMAPIEIKDLYLADLGHALRKGLDDFMAMRTDVLFIVIIYPLIGALLTWTALNRELLPMLFPLVAGFALLGPAAAIGLYEMSRRREQGQSTGWGDAFRVVTSRSVVPILVLTLYLAAIFGVWLFAAYALYGLTLGPEPPASIGAFVGDIFTTWAGWVMLVGGVAIGFVFALVVLAISIVSFPLLLDRPVGLPRAVTTSVKLALRSPVAVIGWGAIVVVLLGLGVLTVFIGLVIALPVLGHATWHLYRLAVEPVH